MLQSWRRSFERCLGRRSVHRPKRICKCDVARDALVARVKSNAKFQCESSGGYEQKATNETKNLPADPDDRVGDHVPQGIKKYYIGDTDAALER